MATQGKSHTRAVQIAGYGQDSCSPNVASPDSQKYYSL
jgi:hypothetical protein